MNIREIIEARRNPELNPKTSINQVVKDYLNQSLQKYPRRVDRANAFVSFTSIEKLGINPRSSYDTPIGIYAYPLVYVVREVGDQPMSSLPFAGDSPWANLFSVDPSANILDLNKLSFDGYKKYVDQLIDKFDYYAEEIEDFAREVDSYAKVSSSGGYLWYVTYKLAKLMGKRKNNASIAWNHIFRTIGIDGAVDWDGEGIIHENEEIQAVFFTRGILTDFSRVPNKYSPSSTRERKSYGSSAKFVKKEYSNLTPEEMIEKLKQDGWSDMEYMSKVPEKVQVAAVSKDPVNIKFIRDPHPAAIDIFATKQPNWMFIQGSAIKPSALAAKATPEQWLLALQHSHGSSHEVSQIIQWMKAMPNKVTPEFKALFDKMSGIGQDVSF